MTNFFTSDLHFFHKKICEYTNRNLFTTPEEHTDWVIDIINKQVNSQSTLYHLGDFAFSSDPKEIEAVLNRINCQVRCIKGNHCSSKTWKRVSSPRLQSFKDYEEIKLSNGKTACLFHFPMHVWHKQHYGSYHLHGHCHGSYQGQGKILDVGLDNAYNLLGVHRLFTEEEVISFMMHQDTITNDHHQVRQGE